MRSANGTGILYIDFYSDDGGTTITTKENFALVHQAIMNGAYAVGCVAYGDVTGGYAYMTIADISPDEITFSGVAGLLRFTAEGMVVQEV